MDSSFQSQIHLRVSNVYEGQFLFGRGGSGARKSQKSGSISKINCVAWYHKELS